MKTAYYLYISLVLLSCQKRNIRLNDSQVIPQIGLNTLSPGWTYSQPNFLNKKPINDVFFLNTEFGALISNGDLFTTNDAGGNWKKYVNQEFNSSTSSSYNLFITPNKDIFLVGRQNIFRVRNDSLQTTVATFSPIDVYFVNENIGYLVSNSGPYRTSDAGKTWSPLPIKLSQITTTSGFGALSFLSTGKGLITTSNRLATNLQTDTVWQGLDVNNISDIRACFMVSEKVFYVSTGNKLYRSINGGESFSPVFSLTNSQNTYIDIHFLNENIGYFCAMNKIYKTIDGGNTWQIVVSLTENTNEIIIELHFLSQNVGWACTSLGGILKYKL